MAAGLCWGNERARQQLSDTATEMFMERGFDAVRVAEIAAVCSVSEKTVFQYFPTKESVILDRWDSTTASVRTVLADTSLSPIQAVLQILDNELGSVTTWLAAQDDPVKARQHDHALRSRTGERLARRSS